ncbi:hypothetical protein [Enterococcus sp. AD013-P3]|uniref:hypothetical protein n=1 Tax=Enterococcus sp. AD013-P3 TaxID=3411036 RepID=UPI003B93C754
MGLKLSRKTGFYGMGSGFRVTINGRPQGSIGNEETKVYELPEDQATGTVQISFSLLKSKPYYYDLRKKPQLHLEVTMNPSVVLVYLFLFVLLLVATQNLLLLAGGLVAFVIFLTVMLRQAFLIKEASEN